MSFLHKTIPQVAVIISEYTTGKHRSRLYDSRCFQGYCSS